MVHTAKNLYRKQGFTSQELDFISIEPKCRIGVLLTTVEVLGIINLPQNLSVFILYYPRTGIRFSLKIPNTRKQGCPWKMRS